MRYLKMFITAVCFIFFYQVTMAHTRELIRSATLVG